MTLRHVAGSFAIHRFAPDTPVPPAVLDSDVFSVSRTAHELSVLCRTGLKPLPSAQHTEADWSCLEVEGPLAFTVTGVLAELSQILAGAGVSLFAVSTHDTDYLFVKTTALETAMSALARAGCAVESA